MFLCLLALFTAFPASAFASGSEQPAEEIDIAPLAQQEPVCEETQSDDLIDEPALEISDIYEEEPALPEPADEIDAVEEDDAGGYEINPIAPYDTSIALYASYTMSSSYKSGKYYTALKNYTLTHDQRKDIVAIAYSQVGYCESNSSSSLAGTTQGTGNYTEYGSYTGYQGQAWCASFISWCAYQAGVSTAVIPVNASAGINSFGSSKTYNSSKIQPGDIIFLENGEHVGIVYSVSGNTLTAIEGNYSNKVTTVQYTLSTGTSKNDGKKITHYYSPSYQWEYSSGNWYYYAPGSTTRSTGWIKYNGNSFYLDPSNGGAMVTGWKKIGSYWYYFNDSGHMQTGWLQRGSTWYYLDSEGKMLTGWQTINGYTYYLGTSNDGAMAIGWTQIGSYWYYFDDSGHMKTGWLQRGSTWYYLNPTNGRMLTGWQTISEKTYYFDTETGAMATGWQEIGSRWYFFESTGARKTGWYNNGSYTYYLDPSMTTSWKKIDGFTYYFEPSTGHMVTGKRTINGVQYEFDSQGRLLTTGSEVASEKTDM